MPWALGSGAPAGEWVPLPRTYGGGEARWTAGKGEAGLRLRVGGAEPTASVGLDGYGRFRWRQGDGWQSLQAGRVLVWLRDGKRLGDKRWEAHHQTRTAASGGGLHRKRGGVVRALEKGSHRLGHASEGGRAKAARAQAKSAAATAKVEAMNKARAR